MVEIDRRENNAGYNPRFLKIRQAALEKAFAEIRTKRFDLNESRSQGWISENEYQQNLINLIVEGNDIKNQQNEIAEKLGI
ncbi:MAG: hypothetical protein P1Q69_16435 [Candidatus Thorarchaeota archaeon]|nr:hypothetical protein [Candidatus Thorarchaeota archaeon]